MKERTLSPDPATHTNVQVSLGKILDCKAFHESTRVSLPPLQGMAGGARGLSGASAVSLVTTGHRLGGESATTQPPPMEAGTVRERMSKRDSVKCHAVQVCC